MTKIKIRSFDDWIKYVFDHPVHPQKQAWYFDLDAPMWDEQAAPQRTINYITQLFENAAEVCAPYSDEQLNQGFWFLLSNGASNHMFTLKDDRVPIPDRENCIHAMVAVFEQLFAVRCSPHLSHTLRAYDPDVNPLNGVCYMWWDIIPIGASSTHNWLNSTCLDVMEHTLQLKSIACQESALHGLGHWGSADRKRVEGIIDHFLAKHPKTPLYDYAQATSSGCIL